MISKQIDDAINLVVVEAKCDAMEETRYSGTRLEGARKALDDTITVYVAEMVRAAVARCPECDGDGVVEKCDWPGEHANRHQEPCPSCRPAEQSLPTDTEIEAWMARCSGVQYAGGGSVSMCIEDWDWAVEMLKRRTKPDATDQSLLRSRASTQANTNGRLHSPS